MNDKEMLVEAGFTEVQADVLLDMFALQGHGHSIDDVAGLEEALEDDGDEEEEEE